MAEFTICIGNKNYSSWSLRAWLPLKESGFAFDEVVLPLREPGTADAILAHSPAGKVPVLRHGPLTIWDSLAIGEYLAELSPGLLPTAREARAVARAVIAEMHSGFVPLRQHLPMNMRAHRPDRVLTAEVQADIDRITQIWRDLRARFGNGQGGLLFGSFTLADAAYAPVVSRFRTYGIALDPASQAYADAVWALPSLQQWLAAAEREPMVMPNNEV
ncbi:MAG TPA: glutathione S-transferase family protein [Stellaceae bacterium]|nr:glutathione S-transferase family protein [Stellaceae bacterium]